MEDEGKREAIRRQEDRVLLQDFNELADTVLGSRVSDLRGGGREDNGVVHDIAEVKADVKTILKYNGKNKTKLNRGEKVLLWVAGIGGIAHVVAAAIID